MRTFYFGKRGLFTSENADFLFILASLYIQQMDEHTSKAFATDDAEMREKYRAIVKAMQELFVMICKVGE